MNFAHNGSKLLITGKSGSGKTTYAGRYLLGNPAEVVFVYDHKSEMAARFGFERCLVFDDLRAALADRRRVICFDPCMEFEGDNQGGFEFFADWSYNLAKATDGTKLFFCDEIHTFSSTSAQPFYMSALIEQGRIYEIDFCGISQAPNQLHNHTRAQLTEVVSFTITEPLPLCWLADLGLPADEIQQLPKFQFIARDFATGDLYRGTLDPPTRRPRPGRPPAALVDTAAPSARADPRDRPGADPGDNQDPPGADPAE